MKGSQLARRVRDSRPRAVSLPPFRRKLLFEALEPRVLLSADLNPAHEALLDAAATPLVRTVEREVPSLSFAAQAEQQNAIVRVDPSLRSYHQQIVLLDLDGANDVDYQGPVDVSDIDV